MNEDVKYLDAVGNSGKVISRVNYKTESKRVVYRFVKRSFDIVLSLIGLLFLLPIALIVKIIYICTGDFDSIFFSQKRIGKNGKEFNFYKIRTMVINADEELEKLLARDSERKKEYEINKKLADDPRITVAGKFLRKSSLDELPQLVNILFGEMSFIGNRPYLPREKESMGVHFHRIVSTKPGLTGYWQVSGRSDTSFDYRLELEEYYSAHCGFRMDIKIFFKTFAVVLLRKGADK